MKVITTNRLNRFWKNGVKPIKDALANKLNMANVVNNLLTTVAGYALDARQGKVLDDKITALNGKLNGLSVYSKGYVIINPKGADYAKIATITVGGQYAVVATNGDQNANPGVHITSTEIWFPSGGYNSGGNQEVYVYLNKTLNANMRINYVLFKIA